MIDQLDQSTAISDFFNTIGLSDIAAGPYLRSGVSSP